MVVVDVPELELDVEKLELELVVGGVVPGVVELLELVVGGVVAGVVELLELVVGEVVAGVVELLVLEVITVVLELLVSGVVPGVVELVEAVVPKVAGDVLVVRTNVLDVESVVAEVLGDVAGVVEGVVLDELEVPAVVPKVAGLLVLELRMVVMVLPDETMVVKVPDVAGALPVAVSGPLDEPEVGAEDVPDVLVDGGAVIMHLHALVTRSIFF